MPLYVSELGLNIIQFISNLYVSVFLYIAGVVSIPCMLEKDCNSNPIFNFPPCYAFQMICCETIVTVTLKMLFFNPFVLFL